MRIAKCFLISLLLIIDSNKLVILSSYELTYFDLSSRISEHVRTALDVLMVDGKVSPEKRSIVYWSNPIEPQEVWFSELDQPNVAFRIALPSDMESERISGFVETQWLFGERWATVRTGVTENLTYGRHPERIVTNSWLVDTEVKTASMWPRDCNEIVRIVEMNSFALRCPLMNSEKDRIQPYEMLLTLDGPKQNQDWTLETVYKDTIVDDYFLSWKFAPSMDKVIFVEYNEVSQLSVSIYDLTNNAFHEKLLSIDYVYEIMWSPSERYVALANECGFAGADCIHIVDVKSGDVVWTSKQMHSNRVRNASIIWTMDEESFFVYGQDYDSFAWFLWHVSLNDEEHPIAIWEMERGGILVDIKSD